MHFTAMICKISDSSPQGSSLLLGNFINQFEYFRCHLTSFFFQNRTIYRHCYTHDTHADNSQYDGNPSCRGFRIVIQLSYLIQFVFFRRAVFSSNPLDFFLLICGVRIFFLRYIYASLDLAITLHGSPDISA